MSLHTRNNIKRWQRDAPAFIAEHGHKPRVFCSSLADVFDNEVPDEWRNEAFADMQFSDNLLIQICTKRVGNVETMVPNHWKAGFWPPNVGLLITVVTDKEVRRDVPKLLDLKRRLGIPWVGLSIEPLVEDVSTALLGTCIDSFGSSIDWLIVGGESGLHARPYDVEWAYGVICVGQELDIATFHKQLGAKPMLRGNALRLKDPAGKDPSEWPKVTALHLETREFPRQLEVA